MLGQRLQLIWGPPGSGKTHFLAATILTLVEAHCKPERPQIEGEVTDTTESDDITTDEHDEIRAEGVEEDFRVLVVAFTHKAINNLMRKILALRQHVSSRKVDNYSVSS